MSLRLVLATCCMILVSARATETGRPNSLPPQVQNVGITEKLGQTIPLDLKFKNEDGKTVSLSEYFHTKKPVLLSLVYYECPSLCNLTLNGMTDTFRGSKWTPGKEFEVVTVSINPKEGPELATKKKRSYIQSLGKLGAENGWHFLTGEKEAIDRLASAVGFKFQYDPKTKEYAHAAALQVLTPAGVISRYFFGVRFFERDLRFSLLEASDGKVGNVIEKILMFCFRYDPELRGYALVASRLMQVGGALMVLLLGGYLAAFWLTVRRKNDAQSDSL